MVKNKKGQGLPINVIIIAALALVVLVVLVLMFTGRFQLFSEGLQNCLVKGGSCEPASSGCKPNEAPIINTNCENEKVKGICCVKVTNS